ncbi:MAG: hypothetical protein IJ860_07950, partial [Eubacterium sp.]|nr:hypothetical protein [Eubacterium sp.]
MEWSKSYSTEWRIFRVNRDTWADAEQVMRVDSMSISRTADGKLLESGGLEATGELTPDYYRIVMTAIQGGEITRVDVATLLFDIGGGNVNYGAQTQDMSGFSVLYPASKTAIIAGEYAPAGVDGAMYAGDLLASTINAPVEVEGSFTLNDHVVHEPGSYVLDAVWSVLDAGNFVIQIDGRGIVHIRPRPISPALILDSSNTRLLQNGIGISADISSIPNRYIVIIDDNRTIAVNDDPNSEVSTVSRGYFVDVVDESPTPVNGETIGDYATRRLSQLSVLESERTYTREYAPDVNLYDIVRGSIAGLQGDM